MTDRFTGILKSRGLLRPGAVFMAAVSGGVDSVVLCELCHQAGLYFTMAHCNFGLRGTESDRDEKFVRLLGEKYKVDVLVKKFETEEYSSIHKCSIQEAARELRYEWFKQLEEQYQYTATLLAHHANDNVETLLMNFFRGTGLEGLTAIKEFTPTGKGFRPLLTFTRMEIENFARTHYLEWVEDSSNASSKYTRNFFRNELLPSIQKVFPQVEQNLLDNIRRFRDINEFYKTAMHSAKNSLCENRGDEVRIPVRKLMKIYSPALVYEIFKDFGFGEKQVEEISKLLKAGSGKYIENEKFQVIRHRLWLVITPRIPKSMTIAIGEDVHTMHFGKGILQLELLPSEKFILQKSPLTAQLDRKEIEFPLLLRKWKQGDYFYPLGMRKKKKVARFFIDQKLSRNEKENVWVIESNKRIAWVVGMRIDERFKITPATSQVLQLVISSP